MARISYSVTGEVYPWRDRLASLASEGSLQAYNLLVGYPPRFVVESSLYGFHTVGIVSDGVAKCKPDNDKIVEHWAERSLWGERV